jgi:hypothetical protein
MVPGVGGVGRPHAWANARSSSVPSAAPSATTFGHACQAGDLVDGRGGVALGGEPVTGDRDDQVTRGSTRRPHRPERGSHLVVDGVDGLLRVDHHAELDDVAVVVASDDVDAV